MCIQNLAPWPSRCSSGAWQFHAGSMVMTYILRRTGSIWVCPTSLPPRQCSACVAAARGLGICLTWRPPSRQICGLQCGQVLRYCGRSAQWHRCTMRTRCPLPQCTSTESDSRYQQLRKANLCRTILTAHLARVKPGYSKATSVCHGQGLFNALLWCNASALKQRYLLGAAVRDIAVANIF